MLETSLPAETRYPAKIRLSNTAEAYIAGLAIDLLLDELQLWQLPPSLLEFHTYAYEAGRQSLRDRITRLEWERDLYYFLNSNRSKNAADFYGHQTSALWREGSR